MPVIWAGDGSNRAPKGPSNGSPKGIMEIGPPTEPIPVVPRRVPRGTKKSSPQKGPTKKIEAPRRARNGALERTKKKIVGPMMKSGDESDDAFHWNHENHRNGETDISETDWSTVPGSRNGTKTLT